MTREDEVSYFLRDWYGRCESLHIHSWHPPSGKTYEAALVRIPKLENGRRSRKRYHLDFIVQVGSSLILQELKGDDDELQSDITKLREITTCYSVEQLVGFLSRRVHNAEQLGKVTRVLPSIGHKTPIRNATPPEFLRMAVGEAQLSLTFGSQIGLAVQNEIRSALKHD